MFASVEDLEALWRPLKSTELERATSLLDVVSDTLCYEAEKVGRDMYDMVCRTPGYANVVKSVVVDIVARALMTSTDTEPMKQFSEAALGYSISGTYLVPGGGLFIKDSELARLGLKRQRWGAINFYDTDKGSNCNIN